jgi:2-polyprenyl-3-methyl-5-hydroxy-6-metoxy-1,4-benzoquinol methylase
MKDLPDDVRWHIKEREKTSKEEAVYISQVINFFRKKLNEKYSSILDVACGNGRLHPYLRNLGLKSLE